MYLLHTIIHGQQRLQSLALQHVGELHVNGLHGAGVAHNPVFVWIRGVVITGRSEWEEKSHRQWTAEARLREIERVKSNCSAAHRPNLTAGMCLRECVEVCLCVCLHGQDYKWQQSTVCFLSRLLKNDTLQFYSLVVSKALTDRLTFCECNGSSTIIQG